MRQILEESDAFRRGLKEGDQLLRFAERPLTSTNQYKNVLGIYPKPVLDVINPAVTNTLSTIGEHDPAPIVVPTSTAEGQHK